MKEELVITNARVVLPKRVVEGSVVVKDGLITAVENGGYYPDGYDARGHWLIPGVIDIHTDYIEKELHPRPSASFPIELAFHMMDMRALASGLTTVLGAVRISNDPWKGDKDLRSNYGLALADEYERMARISAARHYMHIRWDTNFEPVDEIADQLGTYSTLGNIVYNENIPGQRQFRSLEEIATKRALNQGITPEKAMAELQQRIDRNSKIDNRSTIRDRFSGKVCIGSHDDTTVEHVDEAKEAGATLSEMPTTIEAARRAKALGLYVCMGAPNYYRGGSHCGNLSCIDALEEDLVDALCSDYHFPSMLGSVVKMIESGMDPSRAVNLVTLGPAKTIGWEDRLGSIEVGKTADLTLFEPKAGYGRVEEVWVDGVSKFSMNSSDSALVS